MAQADNRKINFQGDKTKNDITERLAKLKSNKSPLERALESKMPLRTENQETDEHQEIKIPRIKKFGTDIKEVSGVQEIKIPTPKKTEAEVIQNKEKDVHEEEIKILTSKLTKEEHLTNKSIPNIINGEKSNKEIASSVKEKTINNDLLKTTEKLENKEIGKEKEITMSSILHGSKLTYEKEKINAAVETLNKEIGKEKEKEISISSSLHGPKLTYEKEKIEAVKENKQKQGWASKLFGINNKKVENISGNNKNLAKQKDDSIFGGDPDVSRIKLEYKMRKDPNIWKAARDVKLNMSPVERSKLVKEVFSQAYGRNISKTDLKWGIKKLNQKLVDAKDKPTEHEKIRKEIKFFKKIGGIKD